MSSESVKKTIIGLFVAIVLWDVWLYMDDVPRNSISQVIIDWDAMKPYVTLVMGWLIGHWFG